MRDVTYSVSEALETINDSLEQIFPFILIEGEVASFKVNQSKFVFFDIKDESSSLGCFMITYQLKFPLEDGMKVKILAQPKLTKWGKFSLSVKEVQPIGEGSLKKAFEILKKKLEAEGLFDEERKRALPRIPQRIGVVSSTQAAGYKDFLKILDNRWGGLEIIVADTVVQGLGAPEKMIQALESLNQLSQPLDVIAIVRGGGSADDLSAFNSEDLVRAVVASRTPVIAGIGHEVDISLVDLVADRRAATPSNAAEILVPDKQTTMLDIQKQTNLMEAILESYAGEFELQKTQLVEAMFDNLRRYVDQKEQTLKHLSSTIRQLNPDNVLKRGYSIVRVGGSAITSAQNVTMGDELSISLKDGEIEAEVTNVRN